MFSVEGRKNTKNPPEGIAGVEPVTQPGLGARPAPASPRRVHGRAAPWRPQSVTMGTERPSADWRVGFTHTPPPPRLPLRNRELYLLPVPCPAGHTARHFSGVNTEIRPRHGLLIDRPHDGTCCHRARGCEPTSRAQASRPTGAHAAPHAPCPCLRCTEGWRWAPEDTLPVHGDGRRRRPNTAVLTSRAP